MSEVTKLLGALAQRDPCARGKLLPLVYDELRRMARARMAGEKAGHTLQATALVHEAYLRLLGGGNEDAAVFDGRPHFFAAAAEAMRRILVDHARRKHAVKRGGDLKQVKLNEQDDGGDDDCLSAIASPCDKVDDLLALDEALDRLAAEDPGNAELVKLLFFVGLPLEQAGAALGLSKTTAHRRWVYARAWLLDAMERGGG